MHQQRHDTERETARQRDQAEAVRIVCENEADNLGAIVSVATQKQRGPEYYQSLLSRFRALSHVTVQVQHQ